MPSRTTRDVLLLTLLALTVRLAVASLTIDIPGDGPAHATGAYYWSRAPQWITHGTWLPGFTYLAGIVATLVDDPGIAARAVNVAIGALTVPLLYGLTRDLYGRAPAVTAAALVALCPLHVGLSASSLTEPSFVFAMLAAIWCLMQSAESGRASSLALFVGAFVAAETIRYEAWLFIPLFVAYAAYARRTFASALCLTVALIAFPMGWSLGNYRHAGNPIEGYSAALAQVESVTRIGAIAAARELGRQAVSVVGWIALVTALIGTGREIARIVRGDVGRNRILYLVTTVGTWVFLLWFTMSRGPTVWPRYLLFGVVLMSPLCALAWQGLARDRYGQAAAFALLGSVVLTLPMYGAATFVTLARPTEIIQFLDWLHHSPYHRDSLIFTRMEWQPTYVPLYARELIGRFRIISDWDSDAKFLDFLRTQHPTLLVTDDDDRVYQERFERLVGAPLAAPPIHVIGSIRIYDIRPPLTPGGER